jgi:hypothetical protein
MTNYFLGILGDKPCEGFATLVRKQMQLKKQHELAAPQPEYEEIEFEDMEYPPIHQQQVLSTH